MLIIYLEEEKGSQVEQIIIKQPFIINGVLTVIWIKEELWKMKIMVNIQYKVIGKFSYGFPDQEDLRIQTPKQCTIKEDYKIGLLRNWHILMRFSHMEDFVNIMNKNV